MNAAVKKLRDPMFNKSELWELFTNHRNIAKSTFYAKMDGRLKFTPCELSIMVKVRSEVKKLC